MKNPANPLQASRSRSTENTREGLQPNRSQQRSSWPSIRCQKRQKPRGATCPKPQAPEEEHHTRWNTKSLTKDTANQRDRAPPQEQDRQLEPEKFAYPPTGNLRQDTLRKDRMRRRKRYRSKLQSVAQQQPTPHPAGGEEEDTAPPPQKGPTHKRRDNQ